LAGWDALLSATGGAGCGDASRFVSARGKLNGVSGSVCVFVFGETAEVTALAGRSNAGFATAAGAVIAAASGRAAAALAWACAGGGTTTMTGSGTLPVPGERSGVGIFGAAARVAGASFGLSAAGSCLGAGSGFMTTIMGSLGLFTSPAFSGLGIAGAFGAGGGAATGGGDGAFTTGAADSGLGLLTRFSSIIAGRKSTGVSWGCTDTNDIEPSSAPANTMAFLNSSA